MIGAPAAVASPATVIDTRHTIAKERLIGAWARMFIRVNRCNWFVSIARQTSAKCKMVEWCYLTILWGRCHANRIWPKGGQREIAIVRVSWPAKRMKAALRMMRNSGAMLRRLKNYAIGRMPMTMNMSLMAIFRTRRIIRMFMRTDIVPFSADSGGM